MHAAMRLWLCAMVASVELSWAEVCARDETEYSQEDTELMQHPGHGDAHSPLPVMYPDGSRDDNFQQVATHGHGDAIRGWPSDDVEATGAIEVRDVGVAEDTGPSTSQTQNDNNPVGEWPADDGDGAVRDKIEVREMGAPAEKVHVTWPQPKASRAWILENHTAEAAKKTPEPPRGEKPAVWLTTTVKAFQPNGTRNGFPVLVPPVTDVKKFKTPTLVWTVADIEAMQRAGPLKFVVVSAPIMMEKRAARSKYVTKRLLKLAEYVNGPKPAFYHKHSSDDDYFNQMLEKDAVKELVGNWEENERVDLKKIQEAVARTNVPWWMLTTGHIKGALRITAYRQPNVKVVAVCISNPTDDPFSRAVSAEMPDLVGDVARDMAAVDLTELMRPSERFAVLTLTNFSEFKKVLANVRLPPPPKISNHTLVPTKSHSANFVIVSNPVKDSNQRPVKRQLLNLTNTSDSTWKLAIDFPGSSEQKAWDLMMRKIGKQVSLLEKSYAVDPKQEKALSRRMAALIHGEYAFGWWMRYIGSVKGALMQELLRADDAVVYAVCIKGSLVADVKSHTLPILVQEVVDDLKAYGMVHADRWVKVINFKSVEDFKLQWAKGGIINATKF